MKIWGQENWQSGFLKDSVTNLHREVALTGLLEEQRKRDMQDCSPNL